MRLFYIIAFLFVSCSIKTELKTMELKSWRQLFWERNIFIPIVIEDYNHLKLETPERIGLEEQRVDTIRPLNDISPHQGTQKLKLD